MTASDPSLLAALAALPTATIHEALGKAGAMTGAIKPLAPGTRLAGPALTVACPPGDNLGIHAAVDRARPGEVLVVDFGAETEAGPFGDVLATFARARGVAGLVIDGCVRDGANLRAMGFPVFARGLCMKGTTKTRFGSVGAPVVCGGVEVRAGDIVLGDDDGVVVVPQALVADVVSRARAREQAEAEMFARIEAGASTMDLLALRGFMPGA
ncbi:MAG: 4-carboxy-4-hydroxy-2-oxoadipate aldolase/oxaloacetate decarboxylase [Rhodobacteraceae bacterium]|jgi:4-hydroxy-4-methyl-2-oxoglutarate aldolase|nr:4-carboxy-4-hydroxy-2-oxoadipate aldolase/oxaloacetate decarboxylase [Paracoccaceae bacterium]